MVHRFHKSLNNLALFVFRVPFIKIVHGLMCFTHKLGGFFDDGKSSSSESLSEVSSPPYIGRVYYSLHVSYSSSSSCCLLFSHTFTQHTHTLFHPRRSASLFLFIAFLLFDDNLFVNCTPTLFNSLIFCTKLGETDFISL